MDKSWKLLYDFNTFEQAQVLLQTLEEQEIKCLLLDEHSSKFVNYFRTHGGVRLLVNVNDFEKAQIIAREMLGFQKSESTLELLDKRIGHQFLGELNIVYKLLIIVGCSLLLVLIFLFFLLNV